MCDINSLKTNFSKLLQFNLYDLLLLVICIGSLPLISFLLKIVRYQNSKKLLSLFLASNSVSEETSKINKEKIIAIARIVHIAGTKGILRKDNCLEKSLLLWVLISRFCNSAIIRFGVQKTNSGSIKAHAWVEYDGTPLIDSMDVYKDFSVYEKMT
jgi:hypothetical protein